MSDSRKRILVLVDWYLPGFRGGGPITSIANLVQALGDRYHFSIITSDTDAGLSTPYPGVLTDAWVERGPDCRVWYCSRGARSYRHIRKLVGETDYDLLYLNSMFSLRYTLYPLWSGKAAKPDIPILLAPRGMLHEGALSLKPLKKKLFLLVLRMVGIHKHIHFQATDAVEVADIKKVFGQETHVVEAPNLPRTHQPPFASIPKPPGSLKLVFMSRLSEKKGLHLLLQWLGEPEGHIHLDIIGPDAEPGYWERCQQVIATLPQQVTVHKHPALPPDEALAMLMAAHCFVMPTRGENFGHAIFESLSVGRPVLISDQTPWRDLAIQRVGFDIPLAHVEVFQAALRQLVAMDQVAWEEWALASWNYAGEFLRASGGAEANAGMLDALMQGDPPQLQFSDSAVE